MKTVRLDRNRSLTDDGRVQYDDRCFGKGISKKKWGTTSHPPVAQHGYAVLSEGPRRTLVHRRVYEEFIGPIPPKTDVDHINGDKTDNRVANLRLKTRSANCKAARKPYKSNSKYRGVHWNKKLGYWVASIANPRIDRYFKTEIEAARAWNEMASQNGYAPEALNVL